MDLLKLFVDTSVGEVQMGILCSRIAAEKEKRVPDQLASVGFYIPLGALSHPRELCLAQHFLPIIKAMLQNKFLSDLQVCHSRVKC